MEKNYSTWDYRDEVFRSERKMDGEDHQAAKHNEPIKQTVPLSFAQVQTFVSFCFLLFTQNRRFFEYIPTGAEDYSVRNLVELVTERDLRHNNWSTILFQFLLDIAKYGVGVIKHSWTTDYQHVKLDNPVSIVPTDSAELTADQPLSSYQKLIRYQGNKLVSISPYKFLPDTRLPLTRFQEGEFCASEEEKSLLELKRLELDGVVTGVKFIEQVENDDVEAVKKRRVTFDPHGTADAEQPETVLLTEMQVRIIPKDFTVDGKTPLGDESHPVMFLFWMVNDNRIIRAEPMGYLHDQFTFDVAQLTPDQHHSVNQSLTDTISGLQDVIDWFVNARVASVRRTLDNQLIVDPTHVDMSTVENRSRIIKLKRNAAGQSINRFVHQLQVNDVTSGHLGDAGSLMEIMQLVTGVSDNAMGQFASGRRSATEARAVNQGSASRLRMVCNVIWNQAMNPLGQKLSLNLRDGLEQEQFVKVVGEQSDDAQLFPLFKSSPERLVGSVDFFVFDGTLPTEKGLISQSLQELFIAFMQNPQMALQFNIDPTKLLEEINTLRGVYNLERFSLSSNPDVMRNLLLSQQANGPTGDQQAPGAFGPTGQ